MYNQIENFYATNKMNADEDEDGETAQQETTVFYSILLKQFSMILKSQMLQTNIFHTWQSIH